MAEGGAGTGGCVRNDTHSALNRTRHAAVFAPRCADDVVALLQRATRARQRVAVAGAHHAMGGQQFATEGWLLDTRHLAGVTAFDRDRGWLTAGAGTRWPQVQAFLVAQRDADGRGWSLRQKQTGADDFTLGGALAANIHGRGLDLAPFVADIEAFSLVTPDGAVRRVDRATEPVLFAHAVGGYGLFGVVTDVTLRLAPRRVLERRVMVLRRAGVADAIAQARGEGAVYGDFQFAIDPAHADFLDRGVFACYHPVPGAARADDGPPGLDAAAWRDLLLLAHTDKTPAFERYAAYYASTHGRRYGSDDHQFGVYLDGYHAAIDACLGHAGSELITELYVPWAALDGFLGEVAADCRAHGVEIIYGTVRAIRADRETTLAWAREDFACVVLNLHVRHDAGGLARVRDDMRRLIDRALARGGSFYLTYHRHARADQLRAAYPRIDAWLAEKDRIDPHGVLSSDWHRALRATLASG